MFYLLVYELFFDMFYLNYCDIHVSIIKCLCSPQLIIVNTVHKVVYCMKKA